MGKLNTIIDTVMKQGSASLTGILHRSKLESQRHNYDKTNTPSVNELKMEELVERCREEIGWSEHEGEIPSPKYFEQVANLSRKSKMYENEIAICEMYIDLVYKYALNHDFTESEIEDDIKPRCIPFIKRIRDIKSLAA